MTSGAQRGALSDDSVVIDRVNLYLHVFMIYILLSYPSLVVSSGTNVGSPLKHKKSVTRPLVIAKSNQSRGSVGGVSRQLQNAYKS